MKIPLTPTERELFFSPTPSSIFLAYSQIVPRPLYIRYTFKLESVCIACSRRSNGKKWTVNSLAVTPQDFIRLANMFQKFNFMLLVRAPQSVKKSAKTLWKSLSKLRSEYASCMLRSE